MKQEPGKTGQPDQLPVEAGKEYFYVKMPASPQIGSAEAEKNEQQLLVKLKSRGPRAETLKPLAVFYSRVGQQDRAYQYLKMWMRYAKDKNEMAECLLMSGQLAEQVGQPEPALTFYQEALAQKASEFLINYYIHNNLGYCLNLRGEYEKGKVHCETAVQLDPSRANAWKNLGISLSGLGNYAAAAQHWLKALHVDASDQRPLELLEKLFQEQPAAVIQVIPDIAEQLAACRKAITTARSGRFADWAKGLTLN